MTDPMHENIVAELARLEQAEAVTVLYACESGSRAWGFESADSDYNVRFMYLRPTRWYLTIQHRRDVIEKPPQGHLDISGWDVTKALPLLPEVQPASPGVAAISHRLPAAVVLCGPHPVAYG